jgi:hypothetical protein
VFGRAVVILVLVLIVLWLVGGFLRDVRRR